jgi:hypothetical protein
MPIESPAITSPGVEPLPEASFYVPATEPTIRLRRNMKRDDCFLVSDSHCDIGASPGGPDGLFDCDTRYGPVSPRRKLKHSATRRCPAKTASCFEYAGDG